MNSVASAVTEAKMEQTFIASTSKTVV